MTHSIATSLGEHLEWLMPFSPALIDASAHAKLARAFERMAAVPRIAFECRLHEGATQVDVQQCFYRGEDYGRLALHARAAAAASAGDSARRAAAFFAELARQGSMLNERIDEIFLEFDLPVDAHEPELPSVFIGLACGDSLPVRLSTVCAALDMLGVSHGAGLNRCFAKCAGRVHIAHVGAMLSRPGSPLRVNVKGLRGGELEPFLDACGWRGHVARAESVFDWALDRVDRVTVALDVGDAVSERISFECFVDEQPAREHAWGRIARELCEQNLCSSAKADALLAIPCDVTPVDPTRRWPAELVASSLSRPPADLSMYARRLTHFKLTLHADGTREAKAYFAALHAWAFGCDGAGARALPLARKGHAVAPSPPPPRSRRVTPLTGAVARGIDFLISRQLQSGLWKDFGFAMGTSDEWVTAFVACQLAATGECRALAAARLAYAQMIRRQRDGGGWGYHGGWWPDADSTAWVLRLATALNLEGEATERGKSFLAGHSTDGGVATYAAAFIPAAELRSHDAWMRPHDCVTGAAAPFVASAAGWLRKRQKACGAWGGYWWQHGAYPTALAVEALCARPNDGDAIRLEAAYRAARAWLCDQRREDAPTAFDLAWCVRILATVPRANSSREKGIQRLLSLQRSDGSWASGARLRVPDGACVEPDGVTCPVSLDHRANFTTAAVLGALAAVAA